MPGTELIFYITSLKNINNVELHAVYTEPEYIILYSTAISIIYKIINIVLVMLLRFVVVTCFEIYNKMHSACVILHEKLH